MKPAARPRLRISLRAKLALMSLLLLALPWVGYRYIQEMENFLLLGQREALVATARAVATALHDRPQLMGVKRRAPPATIDVQASLLPGEVLLDPPPGADAAASMPSAPGEGAGSEAPTAGPAAADDAGSPLADNGAADAAFGPSNDLGLAAPPAPAPALRTIPPHPVTVPPPSAERPAVAEVEAILKGLQRTTSRIWVINRDLRVLALAGSLKGGAPRPDAAAMPLWERLWHGLLSHVLQQPATNFDNALDPGTLASGREVYSALMGVPGSRVSASRDGSAVIVSAAHPIWAGDQVLGVVVVEESTNSILSLRNQAFERLLLLTLGGFLVAAVVVFGFASRLSSRIRRLRDEAENAIDANGRITGLTTGSQAGDEVGDLSRSFSALLGRLDDHHTYLENMASRLSHELRTPIAVVRSSLENLHSETLPESARTYIERADAGLGRLSRILSRMSEATRLEQALAATESERFDLKAVVAECLNGYRVAYPRQAFAARLPDYPVWVRGAPDLAAQMLDKLVENAADFALPGTPIRVELAFRTTTAALSVTNNGPVLPAQLEGRLFEAMVSVRKRDGDEEPHLGLGLYVARMIAGFHGGTLRADNLPGGDGVCFTAVLRLA